MFPSTYVVSYKRCRSGLLAASYLASAYLCLYPPGIESKIMQIPLKLTVMGAVGGGKMFKNSIKIENVINALESLVYVLQHSFF